MSHELIRTSWSPKWRLQASSSVRPTVQNTKDSGLTVRNDSSTSSYLRSWNQTVVNWIVLVNSHLTDVSLQLRLSANVCAVYVSLHWDSRSHTGVSQKRRTFCRTSLCLLKWDVLHLLWQVSLQPLVWVVFPHTAVKSAESFSKDRSNLYRVIIYILPAAESLQRSTLLNRTWYEVKK